MVKKIVAIFSLGLMMLMYSGCGNEEAPIEVEVFEQYNQSISLFHGDSLAEKRSAYTG